MVVIQFFWKYNKKWRHAEILILIHLLFNIFINNDILKYLFFICSIKEGDDNSFNLQNILCNNENKPLPFQYNFSCFIFLFQ